MGSESSERLVPYTAYRATGPIKVDGTLNKCNDVDKSWTWTSTASTFRTSRKFSLHHFADKVVEEREK